MTDLDWDPERLAMRVGELGAADLRDWARNTVTEKLASLGLHEGSDGGLEEDVGSASLLDASTRDGRHLVAVRTVLARGPQVADAAEWIELAGHALGKAPVVMGGPGPFVRWRRAGASMEAPGTSFVLRRQADTLFGELTATLRHEYAQYKVFEWGEGIDDLPYLWIAFRRDPSLSGMATCGRVVYDWDTLTEALTRVLVHGRDDLTALGSYGLLLRIHLRPRDRTRREVTAILFRDRRVTSHSSFPEPRHRVSNEAMLALGWQREGYRKSWNSAFPQATDDDCRHVAQTMCRTLEAWNVKLAKDNVSLGKTLCYRTSWAYGEVANQRDRVERLPLDDTELAGVGLAPR